MIENASETQREQENCSAEVGEHVWATSTTGAWFPDGEHVAMGTCMGTIEHVWATLTMLVEKMVMLLLNIKKSGGPACSRYLMEHYNLKRAADDDDDGHGLNGS